MLSFSFVLYAQKSNDKMTLPTYEDNTSYSMPDTLELVWKLLNALQSKCAHMVAWCGIQQISFLLLSSHTSHSQVTENESCLSFRPFSFRLMRSQTWPGSLRRRQVDFVLETEDFHDSTEDGCAVLSGPASTLHPHSDWEGTLPNRFHHLNLHWWKKLVAKYNTQRLPQFSDFSVVCTRTHGN